MLEKKIPGLQEVLQLATFAIWKEEFIKETVKGEKKPTRLLSEPVGLSAYRKLNQVIKGKHQETVSMDLRRKPVRSKISVVP